MIENRIVSEKRLCDEFGNLIPDENEESQKGEFQEEAWSNNHKKIWSKLPRKVTQGKSFHYFPRGRVGNPEATGAHLSESLPLL